MRVADADAHLPPRVLHVVGFGVGHIDVVMRVEEDAARAAVLGPLVDEGAFLIEELDAVVGTVAHEDSAALVDGDGVQRAELAGRVACLAPCLDEAAIGRELDDAVVADGAVAIGDEDGAVLRDDDIGGRVELVVATAGLAGCAEHHQHFAGGAELDDLMASGVAAGDASAGGGIGDPDIALGVDVDAVGPDEHAAAEALDHDAVGVELEHGVEIGIHALVAEAVGGGGVAAHDGPDVHAVGVNIGVAHRAHGAPLGHGGPWSDCAVGVWVGLGVR